MSINYNTMMRRILIILTIILINGCNVKRDYRDNGNVAFIYKGKSFEIDGKYLSEYPKGQYYILFDSIQIRKSDVVEMVVEFSREFENPMFIDEEDENDEEYYDEYSFFIQNKEIIKITEKFIRDNPNFFK